MAATVAKYIRPVIGIKNFLSSNHTKECFPRLYSVFAPDFKPPILDREEIKQQVKTLPKEYLLGIRVKPADNIVPCSAFYHEDVEFLINLITKKGKREVAKSIVRDAFTKIKHVQLRKYNKEVNEEKKKDIIIKPLEIYLLAVKNATPLMWYMKVKKSGSWFKVPIGINADKARKYAIRWLIETSREKGTKTKLSDQLADELMAAARYEGKALAKKLELHKMCAANRGYMHYWWT